MIYALGHLSGAHSNPAVTIGFWSTRRFPATDVVPYIAAQCIGAVAASAALEAILGTVGRGGATEPAVSVGAAFALEWLLSFVLMFVIMAVATDERVADGFAAIAIGLTVGFCAMVGGPLTGASMNPARSFGPAVVGDTGRPLDLLGGADHGDGGKGQAARHAAGTTVPWVAAGEVVLGIEWPIRHEHREHAPPII